MTTYYPKSEWHVSTDEEEDLVSAERATATYKARIREVRIKYGLTEQEFLDLPDRCQVCSSKTRLAIDHCHRTMKYRGRLCGNCNTALGLLYDNSERIRKLADYLDASRN